MAPHSNIGVGVQSTTATKHICKVYSFLKNTLNQTWLYVKAGGSCPQTSALTPKCDMEHDKLEASAYTCRKEHSVASKIRQNAFPAGAPPPDPTGGSQIPESAGEGNPSRFCTSIWCTSLRALIWGYCTENIYLQHHVCTKLFS